MTTIAWDGTTLAADRLSCDDVQYRKHHLLRPKIERASDGSLMTSVGCSIHGMLLKRWYDGGCKDVWPAPPYGVEKDAYLFVFQEDQILAFQGSPMPQAFAPTPFAKGSGGAYALGAMAMGATAQQAVQIAMQYDAYTGGIVDVLHLHE